MKLSFVGAEISHAEARRPPRRDGAICNQVSVSAGRAGWKRGFRPRGVTALWLRGQIPRSEPGDRRWLQAEIAPQAFVHVAQMAGAVEDSDVLFARGYFRFKHGERFLVSLGDDRRAFFAAEAHHEAFHLG